MCDSLSWWHYMAQHLSMPNLLAEFLIFSYQEMTMTAYYYIYSTISMMQMAFVVSSRLQYLRRTEALKEQ